MGTYVLDSCASRVRDRREALGISPAELSRRAGLSRSQISRIESGQMPRPPAETLGAIARVLGTTSDYLLTGDCDEDELPPEVLADYRLLTDFERNQIHQLLAQVRAEGDSPEAREALTDAIKVAIFYYRGKLDELRRREG